MTTTSTVDLWSLPAGALAADLMRNGGRCAVEGHRRYDVVLDDGRRYLGCALFFGSSEPTRLEPEAIFRRAGPNGAECARLVLAAVPGAMYSLVTEAKIAYIGPARAGAPFSETAP